MVVVVVVVVVVYTLLLVVILRCEGGKYARRHRCILRACCIELVAQFLRLDRRQSGSTEE